MATPAYITVIGLGPGSFDNLTCGALRAMEEAEEVCLRTSSHPIAAELAARGINFSSFDYLYETAETFERVYEEIAVNLLARARQGCRLVYAVPGHPLVAEASVHHLLELAPDKAVEVRVLPGLSSVEAAYAALSIDPLEGLVLADALEIETLDVDPSRPLMVLQIYNAVVASAVKLRLMEFYPDDYTVILLQAVGTQQESISRLPLYMIDREHRADHLTILYLPSLPAEADGRIATLLNIMRKLRGPGGCPWDAQQDHVSLRPYLLEEAYEVLDALDRENIEDFCEELGDLLLQVVFHAQVASEEGAFDFSDVVSGICRKLRRRHPHVFGEAVVSGAGEVLRNWEAIKLEEKEARGGESEIMQGIPRTLPALSRAQKIQEKAARVGLDWPDTKGVLEKICEEVMELTREIQREHRAEALDELGDLFFALVNLARQLGLDAEEALRRSADKFIRRFSFVETKVKESGRSWESFTLDELDIFWNEAKAEST
ncbi:MAG: nucleoside triphosphate pyrophosphohydrolase [bacterium]|nr:nucleoside triphosphate pyrophosphohydrolase [bacterium]MDD3804946.1 nucleoside triphosphate pyrophosphohydrolase [bacterium]MDD4558308.1 nucleoside triphosphate pyrophosphohydrolase [bacterium]